MKKVFVLCVLLLLQSCNHTGYAAKNHSLSSMQVKQQYEVLISRLPGAYTNAQQYEVADDSLKIEPEIGGSEPWVDHQYALFRQVEVPAISGKSVILEWRKGGPEGKISRQRLWSFRLEDSQVFMDFYSFKKPVDFMNNIALGAITQQDLISYGKRCALPMKVVDNEFHLSIPETCRITSRSGRDMILSADITLADELSYKESGSLVDGTPIFMVPGGQAYNFVRVDNNN